MRRIADFFIRLVGYAFVLGLSARAAEWLWVARGLDGSPGLAPLHDQALFLLLIAPVVCAFLGVGFLRPVAIFAAAALGAAAVTAPFALARFTG